ncbi:GNAT family N-acetyltransferase [Streptomyces sp. cmx-4-9]|uniref:GNAT family N-acetyltransferase n=1 Tax=Streptomyces sp. cmx-4-9 TaxID=2790941 RepID=UPI0039802E61
MNKDSDRAPAAGPPCRVRRRFDGDLDACVQALAAVHGHSGYPVNWPEDPGGWLTPSSLLAAWVAEVDGRVVGHVGLSRSGTDDLAPGLWGSREGVDADRAAVVNRLFVAPTARARGIGALLLAQAVREARARGLHPVLDVVVSDTAAAALYERMGWEHLATVAQQWGPRQTVAVRCYAGPVPAPQPSQAD